MLMLKCYFNSYFSVNIFKLTYLFINASSLCLSKSVFIDSCCDIKQRIWYSTSACSSSNLCCLRSNINSACRLNSSFFSFTKANNSSTNSSTSVPRETSENFNVIFLCNSFFVVHPLSKNFSNGNVD